LYSGKPAGHTGIRTYVADTTDIAVVILVSAAKW
jgi:hypothetical protein